MACIRIVTLLKQLFVVAVKSSRDSTINFHWYVRDVFITQLNSNECVTTEIETFKRTIKMQVYTLFNIYTLVCLFQV